MISFRLPLLIKEFRYRYSSADTYGFKLSCVGVLIATCGICPDGELTPICDRLLVLPVLNFVAPA